MANFFAILWFGISLYVSSTWVKELSCGVGVFPAWLAVTFIALVPGYLSMFLLCSLLLDRPPRLHRHGGQPPVSLIMAAYNEEKRIGQTLRSIRQQDYRGVVEIIVVDDGSTDGTADAVEREASANLKLIRAGHGGKAAALNRALRESSHEYIISIDADTLLHPQAVSRIMARMAGDPPHTAAVAGCILVKNSRQSLMTRLQEWDYFLAIASVKRQQALYQGTLVAQGAFSVYRAVVLRQLNGWPGSVGEDIVLTWAMLKAGYRVGFEPTAVAFTEVPATYAGFARQRKRWARGMIEGFKAHRDLLRKKPSPASILVAMDLLFPGIDFAFTFVYIPGIILALTGRFWLAGAMTLAVLPITLLISHVMYRYQRRVFSELGLRIRRNGLGFVLYILIYQILMAPACVIGYWEEITGSAKTW